MANKIKDYRIERFSHEKIKEMLEIIELESSAIQGLPSNHSEVYQKKGWLFPFLFAYDHLLSGRWNYWTDILHKGTIEGSGPIPKIYFEASVLQSAPYNMLTHCIEHPAYGSLIEPFADWLLWGFGQGEKLTISKELNEHFYKMFDLFLLLDRPADYFSHLLSEQTGKGYKSAKGYFPTPIHVATFMSELTLSTFDAEQNKRNIVYEPAVGCGAILLPASNHCFRAYATDISSIAVKLCKIQMFLYAPWFAFCPSNLKGFDSDQMIQLSNDNQFEFWFEERMSS